ncbi:MAG: tripartite tricarboxylate transporter substrate binding protein, partial [Betaproteobacteria bacterium]|nr:tripartite tricarboxylate transporter substrate binding protein [Betaproteobacteria bacterium]
MIYARLSCAIGLALAVAMSGLTHAQPFPNRPIRLISPYPPGGGNDVLARLIAEKMGEGLGQRVIVDNRAGANTIVGTDIVA